MRSWLCLLALACGVATLDSPRDARWFFGGGVVTKVVLQKRVITEVVPSSCVQVGTSLPPCRGMRELTIVPSPTEMITPTASATFLPEDDTRHGRFWGFGFNEQTSVAPSQFQHDEGAPQATPPPSSKPPPSSERPDAWTFNDLFSGRYTTVTQIVVQEETQRFRDREHVITFSVVGCMPTRLPFDLAMCEPEHEASPPVRSLPFAPLDPRGTPGGR